MVFFIGKLVPSSVKKNYRFLTHPILDRLQLHFMSRIIIQPVKKQLQANRELFSKNTLSLPKIECIFHHLRHSPEKNVWSFFRQVRLSLPKLAVKNNSSKKRTKCEQKAHQWWIFQHKVRARQMRRIRIRKYSMLPVRMHLYCRT